MIHHRGRVSVGLLSDGWVIISLPSDTVPLLRVSAVDAVDLANAILAAMPTFGGATKTYPMAEVGNSALPKRRKSRKSKQ